MTHELNADKLSAIAVFIARAGLFAAVYSSQWEFEIALAKAIPNFQDYRTLELKNEDFIGRNSHEQGNHRGLDALAALPWTDCFIAEIAARALEWHTPHVPRPTVTYSHS